MSRLAQTDGLTDVQRQIIDTVRDFTEREILPHAQKLEHADEYPQEIVDRMRELGLFGLTNPRGLQNTVTLPRKAFSLICQVRRGHR